jgi:hypothetical protein
MSGPKADITGMPSGERYKPAWQKMRRESLLPIVGENRRYDFTHAVG